MFKDQDSVFVVSAFYSTAPLSVFDVRYILENLRRTHVDRYSPTCRVACGFDAVIGLFASVNENSVNETTTSGTLVTDLRAIYAEVAIPCVFWETA